MVFRSKVVLLLTHPIVHQYDTPAQVLRKNMSKNNEIFSKKRTCLYSID